MTSCAKNTQRPVPGPLGLRDAPQTLGGGGPGGPENDIDAEVIQSVLSPLVCPALTVNEPGTKLIVSVIDVFSTVKIGKRVSPNSPAGTADGPDRITSARALAIPK